MLRPFSLLLVLISFLTFSNLEAQIYDPVKWTASCNQSSDGNYEITLKATIEEGWNIYSMNLDGDGPIPTELVIESEVELIGGVKESSTNLAKSYDKLFEMELIKLKTDAVYTQKISVKDLSKPITGYISYMVCDKTKCLPPTDEDYSIDLSECTSEVKKKIDKSVGATAPTELTSPSVKEEAVTKAKTVISDVKDKAIEVSTRANKQVPVISKPTTQPIKEALDTDNMVVQKNDQPSTQKIAKSEIYDPVKWSAELVRKNSNTHTVRITGDIHEGWNIYSKDLMEDGPLPSALIIDPNPVFKLKGEVRESAEVLKKEYDPNFEMELIKLKKKVTYEQDIEILDPNTKFGGFLEYMACDISKCIMPSPIEFIIDGKTKSITIGEDLLSSLDSSTNNGSATIDPNTPSFMALDASKLETPVGDCATESRAQIKNKGLFNIFFLGFIGGLLALLTPCVFPMIPLTVSYFTKSTGDKKKGLSNALLYGFFILMVYLLLSIPFHLMDSLNPDILNNISTNVWLNLAFFFIFLFFAFSFFGFYELTLPSSWTNKSSQAEDAGGILGIFFMALTLALVSFSCTGPILGSLLAGSLSSDGGAMQLTSGMAGFGFALALPFALFAAFPSFLNKLPQSGGWLTTVKVILGFLELALAFKFLSNADLVKHWGLLKIEPFLIIEIIIFFGLGLYAFGKIKFPHDGPIKKLSIVRKAIGVLSFLFMFYLMSGFRYDNNAETFKSLSLLSGLAPPTGYSWLHPKECPHNLDCFKDFEKGMDHAKKVGKPILLDFTGHACVNCRKMEEHVWPKEEVFSKIKDDYVLISLYVDDKTKLPEQRKVIRKATGKSRTLRSVGDKWAHFQTEYFENNSQPYYVLLSPDGQLLNNPVPYTPDAGEYASFLECGLENFEKVN